MGREKLPPRTKREKSQYVYMERAFANSNKATVEGRVLIPKVMFEVDPYSAAVTGIKNSVEVALRNGGAMSQDEFDTLKAVRSALFTLDPAAKPR